MILPQVKLNIPPMNTMQMENKSIWTEIFQSLIEFLNNQKVATVTLSQGRYISKVRKLAKSYPDEVQIEAENKDGSILVHMPTSYIKISRSKRTANDKEET